MKSLISDRDIISAINRENPSVDDLAMMLAADADPFIEQMAQKAQAITRRRFGKTISLYVPLYLSNYCPGGCIYCGFGSDRNQHRRKLETGEIAGELAALKEKGFEDVLLLTGDRTPQADFDYLLDGVSMAAQQFHNVSIETFAMTRDEYAALVDAGCTGVTIYQETYDREVYDRIHPHGPKRDYEFRFEAPARAMEAGMRMVGMGVLYGLADPIRDSISLFKHVDSLRRRYWRSGVQVSFPRIRPQQGGFQPAQAVGDRLLARIIFAFRICLPDVGLVLSTRESGSFRDGTAGVGITRMSAASRTTVGGYAAEDDTAGGQFDISDERDVQEICSVLEEKGLCPVFKDWDSVFNTGSV